MANAIGANDLERLEGLRKEVFGDRLENLRPEAGKLMKILKFKPVVKLGDVFKLPVILSGEQGITYAGPEEDVVDLELAEAMCTKPASVKGSQIIGRASIGYKTISTAANAGPTAFAQATETVLKNLMNSSVKRVELAHLYGGSSLAQATASANVSAVETTLTLDPATFAAGIWVGEANARLEIWDEAGGPVQVGTEFKVKTVDYAARTLTVTGSAPDIAALDAAFPVTLDLYHKTSRGKQSLGLDAIITTQGTLFGIDNNVYDLFQGKTYDAASAPLTFAKITDAVLEASHYGLEGDVICLCSPESWQSMNKDEAALRSYDASFRSAEAEKGVEGIVYHYQMGRIKVVSHTMVKLGDAFIFKPEDLMRVGSQDVSMKTPGFGDQIFHRLENKTAIEARTYTDQALFTERPAQMVKIVNIAP